MKTPTDHDNVVPFPARPDADNPPREVSPVVMDEEADAADVPPEPEPEPEPEPLNVMLDEVSHHIARFVVNTDEHALVTESVWTAHTHAIDLASSTPRLAAMSPERHSGKTRLMEVLTTLVARPQAAASMSPSAFVYLIDAEDPPPTILLDEIDTIFGKGGGRQNEDLRRVLNAGHRRGNPVKLREPGPSGGVVSRRTFAPVFLAGLGVLPPTIQDRAIPIDMQPPLPGQKVEPFDLDLHEAEGHALRDRLSRAVAAATINRHPELPPGVVGRDADKWRPMIAIGDAAGGDWSEAVRVAAVAAVAASRDTDPTETVRLLAAMREVFDRVGDTWVKTEDMLRELKMDVGEPWARSSFDANKLAEGLKGHKITSHQHRFPENKRGYTREDFEDAWRRYLSPAAPEESAL